MKELSEAVLGKVRQQAEGIIRAAEEEAANELDKARRRRDEQVRTAHARRRAEAELEAARIIAQARMEARNLVAAAKAEVVDDILGRARAMLDTWPAKPEALARLIAEAVEGLGAGDGIVLGVAEAQLEMARQVVASEPQLAAQVARILPQPINGGVVAQSADGATFVDNSRAARLDMLTPRILSRLGKELF